MSLLEILAVIALIIILTSMTAPVFQQVKEQGNRTACVSNLRQIWLAVSLYRTEHEGDGKYGSTKSMGMPSILEVIEDPQSRFNVKSLRCAHSPHPNLRITYPYQLMFFSDDVGLGQDVWAIASHIQKENTIMAVDLNHNPADHPFMSDYIPTFGLGVTLGGQAIRRYRTGDPDRLEWWAPDSQ
ncbi:MAG: hypothetical protein ACOYON_16365 [Fimbriimonas sp.]